MTFHISWWMIPSLITATSFCYTLYLYENVIKELKYFVLIPASVISIISWITAAVLK